MKGKKLFDALGYVDDKYLDMVDAPEMEYIEMKTDNKHTFTRRSISFLIAAAICVSILAVTAMAAGWIPNIFAAVKPVWPKDAEVLKAAIEATQEQTVETVSVPEVNFTQFTLYERYYDGESILLGYDLSNVMPEPVVGCQLEDSLREKLMEMPDYMRVPVAGMTDDTLEQKLELGIYTQEEYEDILANRSDYAKQYDLRREMQIQMDFEMMQTLSSEQYEQFWSILAETGSCCVAIPGEPYISDHIFVNGTDCGEVLSAECGNFRSDYETDVGDCILLNPLPEAGRNQDSVTVELTLRSGWYYWYMELDGDVYSTFEFNPAYPATFTLENVNN